MQFVILIGFLMLMILVGILSQRKIKTADDYVVGGRRMGPWLSSFSYGTAYFSAVIFVGYAGRFGWGYGLSAIWIGIGNAAIGSLLAWLLLAERTRSVSQAMQVSTMTAFFRKRYDSPGLEKFAAIIIFVFLIPYSASVYQGLGYILQRFFAGTPLQDLRLAMLLMAAITALYLYFGGSISTAINSLIQGMIMFAGILYMLYRVLYIGGGIRGSLAGMASLAPTDVAPQALTAPLGPAPFDLIVLILMTSFGTFGLPQMLGKYQGIRDRAAVRRGALMSTFFALVIGGGAYAIGAFSRLLDARLQLGFGGGNLDTLMPLIFETLLSAEMLAVLVVLLLSASMSTLAAVVLVSAPVFCQIVLKSKRVLTYRLMAIFFVFISYLVAIMPGAIVTLMAFSWGAVSGAFIGPFIWGLFSRKLTRAGAVWGMILGLSTVLIGGAIALILDPQSGTQWAPRLAVLAMAMSFGATPLISVLTRNVSPVPAGARYVPIRNAAKSPHMTGENAHDFKSS